MLPSVAAAADSMRCSLCATPIAGDYVHYGVVEYDVCSTCTAEPRCVTCGLPRAGRNVGDDGHCARCIGVAARCTACGLPIFERYWKVAGSEGIYCPSCQDDAPACSSCGVPTRAGRVWDGRIFCESCDGTRVTEGSVYEALYQRMLQRARSRLGMVLKHEPPLVVESETTLTGNPGLDGPHDGLSGLYVRDGAGRSTIHILSNLTQSRAAAVLAHELAHAWQAEHCPDEQSQRLREGFAEWVAWRLLDGIQGAEHERDIIAARTDIYGDGFRLFAAMEDEHGASHALWWARSVRSAD